MKWENIKKIKDDHSFEKIQKKWKIRFSHDFIEFIIKNNGGNIESDIYDSSTNKERIFTGLLSFDLEDNHNVDYYKDILSDRIAENLFPFSQDPFGNFICLLFNQDEEPSIVLWHHEPDYINGEIIYHIEQVANSFFEFINKLYQIKTEIKMDKAEEDFWKELIANKRKEEGLN